MSSYDFNAKLTEEQAKQLFASVQNPGVTVMEIAHDDWCDFLNARGRCNCSPEMDIVRHGRDRELIKIEVECRPSADKIEVNVLRNQPASDDRHLGITHNDSDGVFRTTYLLIYSERSGRITQGPLKGLEPPYGISEIAELAGRAMRERVLKALGCGCQECGDD
jgi:hypothetical protein